MLQVLILEKKKLTDREVLTMYKYQGEAMFATRRK